ncbi:anaerobic glycerol-3-phosphate dehydrogenase subunit GlpA [Mobiluncus porci]|uniref:Anaerobic glycerol-3-phosphate dehydrogenase subunit A n=1 Tax=Mobiluncus porci TaxID=2652278 RepID=A0A7K0K5A5_9ACTO|nr:anaerobic glycerol-3-phosphate dehydrogenase subunit GlpA [Mobiluncus porci]MST50657.1 anaerobic glycerol-3-phosphate dehydrogenase subunit A [Mobiluncus porci]
MQRLKTEVVVIGGGATGVGVVRDVAMRGFDTILLERADISQGTSARYHGLLHSGGRYVISDPESATQCADENAVLRRINADAIEDTHGFFVQTAIDPDDFADKFFPAARRLGVECEEVPLTQAFREEPNLNRGIKRVYRVHDATIDGWQLAWGVLESAKQYGAKVLPYHWVRGIEVSGDEVRAVKATNEKTGEEVVIDCRFVINACGPWAGQVAELAGCHDVEVVPGRGIMIGFNQRLVHHVINRLAVPGDGDILVPAHPICVIGTTDQAAKNPDFLRIYPEEVQQMLSAGEELVPSIRQARALHVWAGARPLLKDKRVQASDTRHMSRGMAIIDHLQRDGLRGFVTIVGGKVTTYRLMAQNVVNDMCHQLGEHRPCRTAEEPVPSGREKRFYQLNHRLADREADRHEEPIICECELVNRRMVLEHLEEHPEANLDDLRRQLRIGMGPCQGTFCAARTAALVYEFRNARAGDAAVGAGSSSGDSASADSASADAASLMLRLFVSNRMHGILPLLYGQELKEIALGEWVQGTLSLDRLPAPSPASCQATGDMALNHGVDRDPATLGELADKEGAQR